MNECYHFACPVCWAEVYTLLGANSPTVTEHRHPMDLVSTHAQDVSGER